MGYLSRMGEGSATLFSIHCLIGLGAALWAGFFAFRAHPSPILFGSFYWRWLLRPWKLLLLLPSLIFFMFFGPVFGDPTWTPTIGFVMSVMTFASAPYVVDIFVRVWKGQRGLGEFFFALSLLLWSSSWSYDFYWLFKMGGSPLWLENLFVSPLLFCMAGLVWSLDRTSLNVLYSSYEASSRSTS